jgi:hypothetical protein
VASAIAAIAVVIALGPTSATASAFATGLQDESWLKPASVPGDLSALHAVGGSYVRIVLRWALVAPPGNSEPLGFNPSNPGDPHYRWAVYDAFMRTAAAEHINVVLTFLDAPKWAQGPGRPNNSAIGPWAWDPNPSAFAAFAHAAALRYSGTYPDPEFGGATLPRVRLWEIWNEENLPLELAAPDLVGEYRSLLDAGYDAIKAIAPSNQIIIGGLAPGSPQPGLSAAPLPFAAEVMCLSPSGLNTYRASPSCPQRAEFDALGFHPYTFNATPTLHATNPGEIMIADTGRLAAVIHAADRLHTVLPYERHQLWATEWSWFTSPPGALVGNPDRTAARYVDYSMWLLWHYGVSVVIWFVIEDPQNPGLGSEEFIPGGGLWWSSGRPKLMEQAFSFPLIASVRHRRAYVWGRVPISRRVRVYVQRRFHHRWRTVARVWSRSDGTFVARTRARGNGFYRAYVKHGPLSLSYNSRPIPPQFTKPG